MKGTVALCPTSGCLQHFAGGAQTEWAFLEGKRAMCLNLTTMERTSFMISVRVSEATGPAPLKV